MHFFPTVDSTVLTDNDFVTSTPVSLKVPLTTPLLGVILLIAYNNLKSKVSTSQTARNKEKI